MPQAIKTVVFVCTANTCRSPMAEYLFRHMAKKEGLDLEIFSRGTNAWNGAPISGGSKETLKSLGIDASAHRAGKLTKEDVDRADLILVMHDDHRAIVVSEFPHAAKKVFRLKAYAGEGEEDVQDPIGSELTYYQEIRKEIENSLLGVLKKLK